MSKEKLLSTLGIIYFMLGFVFAVGFAVYYKWPPLSFLSPNFFSVVFTWPFQAIGFTNDLMIYGLAGKPI
ncbi:hypothetical protein HYS95_00450 [Candidatus Daviesbacteria bacterium]|nr:hypothetical protein [Candidatus Daviesbacteria bacterium]